MTTESITQLLAEKKAKLAQEFGIQHLGIYGSVAEGRAGSRSDIDLFYDLGEGAFLDLQQLEAFEEQIKRILRRRKVDLVNLRYMNPIVRYRAEKHFIYV